MRDLYSRGLPISLTFILRLNSPIQNLINNSHLQRFTCTHKVIPLHQLLDLVQRPLLFPSQMALVDLIQLATHAQDLLGVDGDIGGLSEVPAGGLMDHDRGMRETVAFARMAAAEKEGAHGGSLADADGAYGGCDVGHCVVDCEACIHSESC